MVGAALCTADFFLEFSSCYLEELAEEAFDLTKYLLQLALSVGVRIEWIENSPPLVPELRACILMRCS